jgi:hypothetical protein
MMTWRGGCDTAFANNAPSVGPSASSTQSTASILDFPAFGCIPPGFGPARPGPVRNKSRLPSGASNFNQVVGDYTNPILKPEAAEVVKKRAKSRPAEFFRPGQHVSAEPCSVFSELQCPAAAAT